MSILLCIPKFITRFICLLILITIDSIFYFIPIYILCLISNIITTLIWYFPSIYQLYSFIFTEKDFNLRLKIYLFVFSPVIIILYIPICVVIFIVYGIFVNFIYRLIIILLRPEYPIYSLSLTAELIHLIYQCNLEDDLDDELLDDSLILDVFKQSAQFMKNCWNFNSIKI